MTYGHALVRAFMTYCAATGAAGCCIIFTVHICNDFRWICVVNVIRKVIGNVISDILITWMHPCAVLLN